MEVLYEWVWNVAVYLLLVTAVTNVLPGDTYRKYLKFFTGVCLVIVMTQPLFSLFGMEEQLENAFRFYRFSGEQEELREEMAGMGEISRRSWLFLILSGLATGASWMCYYRALQLGRASQVVPIDKLSVVITLVLAFVFLHEPFTAKSMVGCALIAAGTLFMVL